MEETKGSGTAKKSSGCTQMIENISIFFIAGRGRSPARRLARSPGKSHARAAGASGCRGMGWWRTPQPATLARPVCDRMASAEAVYHLNGSFDAMSGYSRPDHGKRTAGRADGNA